MSISRKLLSGGAEGPSYVDDLFSIHLYKGDSTAKDIVNGIDLSEGGAVWIKRRDATDGTQVCSPEMGVNRRSSLAVTTVAGSAGVSAFNDDGFSIPASALLSTTGASYVSYSFAKGEKFFDEVKYTGTGTPQAIPHSLGIEPGFFYVRRIDITATQTAYWRAEGGTHATVLEADGYSTANPAYWNDTDADDSTFTVGTAAATNAAGVEYVAYLWAHDPSPTGIVQSGGYSGDAAEQDIDLGWEPQWLWIKNIRGGSGSNDPWILFDSRRGVTYDRNDNYIRTSEVAVEGYDASATALDLVRFTATGFTVQPHVYVNTTGDEYQYLAIRRPNKPAAQQDPTDLFTTDLGTASAVQVFTAGFPVDFCWTSGSTAVYAQNRKDWTHILRMDAGSNFTSSPQTVWDSNDGFTRSTLSSYNGLPGYMWKRAPGFCDVVTWKDGTASGAVTVPHGLGAVPELMLQKYHDANNRMQAYHKSLPSDYSFEWGLDDPAFVSTQWDKRRPTDTEFYSAAITSTGYHVTTYLFASVPGLCHIDKYVGTGADLDIDCGFTNGVRWVMIKRVDAGGNNDCEIYCFDTVNGITAGDDPYRYLNQVSSGLTGDYIDPLPSGFTVTAGAPTGLNLAGGEYIYMAIA